MSHDRGPPWTGLHARPEARPALEAWLRDAGTLNEAAGSHPGAETLEGRGVVYTVPAPMGGGWWVVRHYRRGGTVASILGDRYLRVGTPRPVRELQVGWALEEAGVPTPRHIGCAVYASGPWYRGDLVTELVPHSRDLATILFDPEPGAGPGAPFSTGQAEGRARPWRVEPESAMGAAGSLVRTLHEAGVVHRDLNLKNILIAADPAGADSSPGAVRALVLDLDRATVRSPVGERARRRMIDRFWRSARKWEERTGDVLGAGVREAFEAAYG